MHVRLGPGVEYVVYYGVVRFISPSRVLSSFSSSNYLVSTVFSLYIHNKAQEVLCVRTSMSEPSRSRIMVTYSHSPSPPLVVFLLLGNRVEDLGWKASSKIDCNARAPHLHAVQLSYSSLGVPGSFQIYEGIPGVPWELPYLRRFDLGHSFHIKALEQVADLEI